MVRWLSCKDNFKKNVTLVTRDTSKCVCGITDFHLTNQQKKLMPAQNKKKIHI